MCEKFAFFCHNKKNSKLLIAICLLRSKLYKTKRFFYYLKYVSLKKATHILIINILLLQQQFIYALGQKLRLNKLKFEKVNEFLLKVCFCFVTF